MEAKLIHGGGHCRMLDYTPSGSAVTGGTVVVVGDMPLVAHRDIAVGEQGALAAGGGVYEVVANGALAAGVKVYWDNTANKVSATSTGNKVFGYMEADSASTADGDYVRVLHNPEAT